MDVSEDCHNSNHIESVRQKRENLAIFLYHGGINSPFPSRELSEDSNCLINWAILPVDLG